VAIDTDTRARALASVRGLGLAADHPGAGKDTAFAAIVQSNPGTKFENIKFADALTEEVFALFPRPDREDKVAIRNDPKLKDYPFMWFKIDNISGTALDGRGSRYAAFLYGLGMRGNVAMSMRQHLLLYGTEFTRVFLQEEDRWLNLGVKAADDAVARGVVPVITDVRFPNEAKALKQAGYDIAHIAVDGLANAGLAALTSIAEGHLKNWDFDLRVKNVWGKPENMGVQFNATYRW